MKTSKPIALLVILFVAAIGAILLAAVIGARILASTAEAPRSWDVFEQEPGDGCVQLAVQPGGWVREAPAGARLVDSFATLGEALAAADRRAEGRCAVVSGFIPDGVKGHPN